MKTRIGVRLLALLLAIGPGAASAATLSIQFDQPFYQPGDTIEMTILGDTEGALAVLVSAGIEFDPAAVLSPSAVAFAPPSGTSAVWGSLAGSCTPNSCTVVNMFASTLVLSPVDPAFEPFVYAVVTATVGLQGNYLIGWSDSTNFFGLTAPAEALLVIVPEPTTAALLALGLAALATIRRRCA